MFRRSKCRSASTEGETTTVGTHTSVHLSCFQVTQPENLNFGTLVQICGLTAVRINDTVYLSAKKVKPMECDTYKVLDDLPASFYHLPRASDVERNTSAVLRFRGNPPSFEKDDGAVVNFTLPDEATHYTHDKDDGTREIALKTDFSVIQWGCGLAAPRNVLLSTRLYSNHLDGVGILDPETWSAVAPTVLRHLHGYVPGWIAADQTAELDINTNPNQHYRQIQPRAKIARGWI